MIDEIVIKARLDTKQAEQEFDELKKKGNSTISDIEKNEVKLKVDLDTKQAEAKVNNLNKSSGLLGNITQKAKEGFQGLGSSLAGVLNPMTAIAGAGVAIVGTFFKMIDVNKKFQQSLAELQSITGVTTQDLQFYRNQAQEIARDKTLSSSLEETVNAFKLVGSAKPDLLQNKEALAEVTRQAILLSKASGDTLESSVNSLTGTLNQFNFGAEEAGRVIDVLAAGSKAGAVAIPDLSAGLEKFGAVAKANNVTVEQAVALQETLGDKQIQGAEAGTQLRNIILKLANAGKGYVNGQFDINAALEQTRNEFQNIQDPVKRSQELTKLFGLESVTAGQILLDSTDKFKQYTAAVGEQGVALSQAQTNTNTFDGALTRLSNSFEALLSGGGNLLNIFTPLVDIIAEALPSIGNFFTQLGTAISTFFSESQYVQKVGELFTALFNTVKEVSIGIYNALVEIGSAFGLGQGSASDFAKVIDQLLANVRIAIDGLILLITNFKDVLVGAFQIIALQVKSFVSFWKAIFAGDFRGALNVVISYFDGLANIVTKTFDKVKLNVINAILGITETVRPILESLRVDVNGLTKNLKTLQAQLGKKLQSTAKITTVTDKKNLSTIAASTAITTTTTDVAATEGEEKKASEAAAKALKAKKDLEKFTIEQFQKESKIKQDAFDATLSQQQLEERAVQDKYFELIETAKQYGLDTTALEAKRVAELKAIDDKYLKEKIDTEKEQQSKAYENELKLADDLSKQQLLILKTRLANGEITEQQYNEQIKDLELTTLQSKISIASKWSGTVKKAAEDITTFTNQEADKRLDKEIENNKKREDLLKKQFNEIFEFANNGILLQIGLNPQDVNRVKGSIENLQNTLNNKGATPQEKAAAYAEAAGAVAGTVSNALFAADTQRRQEELAALQAQQEEELRLAGDNEQKKDLIRQKYALKEKDIKRKQAEADKKKAMLDIVINTAVAVVKAFATTGPIAGPVFAAIVGALGLAQLALVAAQPIPKFEKGGAIPSSDIQGMISGKPHAAGGVLIEAEGNEFITRRSQAMKGDNLGLLEAINMSDSERDAYINRHYVMPALQAKESEAAKSYRSSIIEAENNLIARVSSSTLKSIDRRLVETNQSIKGLAKKDYTW